MGIHIISTYPSPATSLPPETLDRIFHFYFTSYGISRTLLNTFDPISKKYGDGSPLSLVCKSWSSAAQRQLFRTVHMKHSVDREKFLEMLRVDGPPSSLGRCVRTLGVYLWRKDVGDEAAEAVNELMEVMPLVGALELNLDAGYDWSHLRRVPGLRKLQLNSHDKEEDSCWCRHILLATPNITSLTLGSDATWGSTPRDNSLAPVDLPSLTHLSLRNIDLCSTIQNLGLLSTSTLSRINHLELHPGAQIPRPRPHPLTVALLETIGTNIQTLTLGEFPHRGLQACTTIISACTNLRTLIATQPIILDHFPSTLTSITVDLNLSVYERKSDKDKLEWLTIESLNGRPGVSQKMEDWNRMKRLEIDLRSHEGRVTSGEVQQLAGWRRETWEKIRRNCAEWDVKLSLNGVLVLPPSHSLDYSTLRLYPLGI